MSKADKLLEIIESGRDVAPELQKWKEINENAKNKTFDPRFIDTDLTVGLFWYDKQDKKLITMPVPVTQLPKDSLGIYDTPISHMSYWESLKKNKLMATHLVDKEYDELPRGRVMLWETDKGEWVIKIFGPAKYVRQSAFIRMIAQAFNFKWPNNPNFKVTIQADTHYVF